MEDLNREKLTGWKKHLARWDFFIYTVWYPYGAFMILAVVLGVFEIITKQEDFKDKFFDSTILRIIVNGYLILFTIFFSLRLWIFFRCAPNWKQFLKRHIFGCLCFANLIIMWLSFLFHWGPKTTGVPIVDIAIWCSGFIISGIILFCGIIWSEWKEYKENKASEKGKQKEIPDLWLYGRQFSIFGLTQELMPSYFSYIFSFSVALLFIAIIWLWVPSTIESWPTFLLALLLSGPLYSFLYLCNFAYIKMWSWRHSNDERATQIDHFLKEASLTNLYGGIVPTWRIWLNRLVWGAVIGLTVYISVIPDKSIGRLQEYAQEEFCKEMQYMDERTAISEEIDYYKAPSFSTSEHIASLTGKQVIHICNRVKDYDEKKDFVHYGPSSFKKILKMNDIKEYAVDHPDDIVAELFYFDAQFTHFGNGYSSEHAYVLVCPDIPTTNQKFRSQVLSYTYEDFVKEVLN